MKKLTLIISIILTVTVASAQYKMSSNCKRHIQKYEKCSLVAYPDAGGYSIGWGHHSNVTKGQKITQKQADIYFEQDCKVAENYANWLLKQLPYKYRFSQGFFDGLASLVYNAGVGGVKRSPFYQRLTRCRVSKGSINSSDFTYTLAAVKTSCISATGHKERRVAEYAMMMK